MCEKPGLIVNLHVPFTGSGGGGGGEGLSPPPPPPTWFGLTAAMFPNVVAPDKPSTPEEGDGRMEMSPSPFLWILMVPCFSSSCIFFSRLDCRWMASSFSFNTCRKE